LYGMETLLQNVERILSDLEQAEKMLAAAPNEQEIEQLISNQQDKFKEILGKQGRALGLKIKNKLPDNKLSTVAKAFTKSWDPNLVKVISIDDHIFHIQGTKCPFGLENTSRELCEAVMEIDYEYFRTAVSDKIKLNVSKTVAEGDSCCDTIYELQNS